jgi:hypothetical protein
MGLDRDPKFAVKVQEILSNLKTRPLSDWLLFWVAVPALMFVVFALPQDTRDTYFILNTTEPWRIQTWFLSSYTHSQLYPHLAGNLAFYFVVLLMIFAFEENRRRFWILAGWSFLAVPFISSLLTVAFWGLLARTTTGQGFSAIIGALLAYAMFIFVVWGIGGNLAVFDHPESFTGTRRRFQVVKVLLIVILALIVVMGLQTGIFMDAGGSVSNGIAHFGGFITSLAVLLTFDLLYEERRYFDTMLLAAIVVGIFWYGVYLVNLVRAVKGG